MTTTTTKEEEEEEEKEHFRCEGAHPLCGALRRRELKPIKLAYDLSSAGWPASLTASAFNRLG